MKQAELLFSVTNGKFDLSGKPAFIEGEGFLHDGWYFWDETQSEHGPFGSKEEAEKILKQYVEALG